MKKSSKKILSIALAAAMSSGMMSAFANTVSIDKVDVLNGASEVATTYEAGGFSNITLSPEQMMRVTVKLSGEDGATEALGSGDVTFLSYNSQVDASENPMALDNKSIQYVDQVPTSSVEGQNYRTAVVTFRPRIDAGAFVAKAGGTDANEAVSFNYTVAVPKSDMTFTGTNVSFEEGGTATFTLKDKDGNDFDANTNIVVKDGETTVDSSKVSYENGVLSVKDLSVGTHSITVEIDGYNVPAAVSVTVSQKKPTGPEEGDKDNAQNKLENAVGSISSVGTGEVTLTGSVSTTAGTYTISYTIENEGAGAEIKDGKLVLKTGTFGAKVQLKADLGNGVEETKTVYLVQGEGKDVSFGNLDMIADSDGKDAFGDDSAFGDVGEHDYTAAAAELLNLALGRGSINNVPQGAVDINLDGKVTLAEYRMFKLLLDKNEYYYVPSNFAAARQNANK